MTNLNQKIKAAAQRVNADSSRLSSAPEPIQGLVRDLERRLKVEIIEVDTEMNYTELEITSNLNMSVSYGKSAFEAGHLRHIADCIDNAKGVHCEVFASDSGNLGLGASLIDG